MGQARNRKEEIAALKSRQKNVPQQTLTFAPLQLQQFSVFNEIKKVLKITEQKIDYNTSMNDSDFEAIFPTNLPHYTPDSAGFFMAFMDRNSYDGKETECLVDCNGKTYKCLVFKDFVVLSTYCSHNFAKEHYAYFMGMGNTQMIAYSTPMQCQVLAEFPIR